MLIQDRGEDDGRYRKLVVRDDVLVGALLLGDWPDACEVMDAVAAGAGAEDLRDDALISHRARDETLVAA